MNPDILTENLTCSLRGRTVLDGVSLSVPSGCVLALLGPNGAGKTLTLRLLLGLTRPSAGRAFLLGVESQRLSAGEMAQIGLVSEDCPVPPWMRLESLLAFLRPLYPSWDQELSDRLVRRMELPLDIPIGRLSRGGRTKASLVAALSARPRVLLLDEPFAGLDLRAREELVDGMLEVAADRPTTIVLCSHDVSEIEGLADRVAFLIGGRLRAIEQQSTLHQRYRKVDAVLREGPGPFEDLPPSWRQLQVEGRRIVFVDTDFDAQRTPFEVVERFGPIDRLDADPMTLRSIYRSLETGIAPEWPSNGAAATADELVGAAS